MITATLHGQTLRMDAVLNRGATWIDRYFCLFVGGGCKPVRVLVRASSCEEAIDLLVDGEAGRSLRISEEELWSPDSDYLCESCKEQMMLPPAEREFDGCECAYWITGDGTPADLDWLDIAGEPEAVDYFAKRPSWDPAPRPSSSP